MPDGIFCDHVGALFIGVVVVALIFIRLRALFLWGFILHIIVFFFILVAGRRRRHHHDLVRGQLPLILTKLVVKLLAGDNARRCDDSRFIFLLLLGGGFCLFHIEAWLNRHYLSIFRIDFLLLFDVIFL